MPAWASGCFDYGFVFPLFPFFPTLTSAPSSSVPHVLFDPYVANISQCSHVPRNMRKHSEHRESKGH